MKKLQLLILSMLISTSIIMIEANEQGKTVQNFNSSNSPEAVKFAGMSQQEKKSMLKSMSPEQRAAFKAKLTPEQQQKLAAAQEKKQWMPRRMARRQARRSGNQG